ncbi:hypothetical protein SPM88_19715, partial [Enterobacter hormaechei subsp. hoffmannii]
LYFPLSETSPASEKTVQPTFDIVCNRLLKMTPIYNGFYVIGLLNLDSEFGYTQINHIHMETTLCPTR